MKNKVITRRYMKVKLKKLIKSLNNAQGFLEQTGYMTADRWNEINNVKRLLCAVINEMSVDEKLQDDNCNL